MNTELSVSIGLVVVGGYVIKKLLAYEFSDKRRAQLKLQRVNKR